MSPFQKKGPNQMRKRKVKKKTGQKSFIFKKKCSKKLFHKIWVRKKFSKKNSCQKLFWAEKKIWPKNIMSKNFAPNMFLVPKKIGLKRSFFGRKICCPKHFGV